MKGKRASVPRKEVSQETDFDLSVLHALEAVGGVLAEIAWEVTRSDNQKGQNGEANDDFEMDEVDTRKEKQEKRRVNP